MKRDLRFKVVDALLIALMVCPILAAILLKVLTEPAVEGISITGAKIFFSIPMPIMDLVVTESQIVSWAVMLSALGLCLYLTHGLSPVPQTKRQLFAEWGVDTIKKLVNDNMGARFSSYAPFIASIMILSAFSSLTSLLGLYPPTSDVNVVAGWSILVFILITYYKLKGGVWGYVKGFFDPIPIFAPFNVIGEIATPVSMAFRHYGNVLSGTVIATLVGFALNNLSASLLGWLPGTLSQFPLLRIGIPAILSIYFDVFSGVLQAFLFAMLTMLYIANGFPEEEYEKRLAKRAKRKARTAGQET